MRRVFEYEKFLRIKNLVISQAIRPNADRCNVYDYNGDELVLCFNDDTCCITCCSGFSDKEQFEKFLNYAYYDSNNADSFNVEELLFYYEEIEPLTECCDEPPS